jgi:predicted dehydrogenase
MEAMHYAYHPVAEHIRACCRGQAARLGELREVEAIFSAPIPEDDIRFDLSLAGGATMDLGCYALHVLRMATGEEPEEVAATAEQGPVGIDTSMEAELRFRSGVRGRMIARMGSEATFESVFRARGSAGSLEVTRFQAPMIGHEITWWPMDGEPVVHSLTRRPTFDFQLEAFLAHLARGWPYEPPFGGRGDAVANMDAIDRVYRAAAMEARPLWSPS